MDVEDAYSILKEYIELDNDNQDAYDIAINNPDEYDDFARKDSEIVISSIKMGQSSIGIGEIIRQFFNATHRLIDDEIVNLPGNRYCKDIGAVAAESIQQTLQINQMTEAFARSQLSCNETSHVGYI